MPSLHTRPVLEFNEMKPDGGEYKPTCPWPMNCDHCGESLEKIREERELEEEVQRALSGVEQEVDKVPTKKRKRR